MHIPPEKIFEMGYILFIEFIKQEGWRVSDETKRILITTYGFSTEEADAFEEATRCRLYTER